MKKNEFKIGDIVHLNSEPEILMTVADIIPTGIISGGEHIRVKYFSAERVIITESFLPETLTLVATPIED
jgi:hypothetical protein